MNFLSGLHGVVAIVLLCSLLFVEEAGVPLPFAPGELTLVVAGLLIAAGGLDPWVFIPLAVAACVAGAVVGFSWARIVGEHGLTGLAVRFHQRGALERVSRRVRSSGPLGIGVTRLIPGLRIYTTLVAGAFGLRRRTFVEGMVPSAAVWVLVFVLLGVVAGIPIEHLLTRIARLAVQGGLLLVIGVGGYLAIRRAPTTGREPMVHLPIWLRTGLAIAIDLAVIVSVTTGALAIARRVTGAGFAAGWADLAVATAAVAAVYLFVTRRGTGATVGEALLHTVYLHHRRLAVAAPRPPLPPDGRLQPAADLLRALAPVPRLAVVRALLGGAGTTAEVAEAAALTPDEIVYHLAALRNAGLVRVEVATLAGDRYRVQERFGDWIAELIRQTSPDGAPLPSSESIRR